MMTSPQLSPRDMSHSDNESSDFSDTDNEFESEGEDQCELPLTPKGQLRLGREIIWRMQARRGKRCPDSQDMDKYFEVFMEAAGNPVPVLKHTKAGSSKSAKRQHAQLVEAVISLEALENVRSLASQDISFEDAERLAWLCVCWDGEYVVDPSVWNCMHIPSPPIEAFQLWTNQCFTGFLTKHLEFKAECSHVSKTAWKTHIDADEVMQQLLKEEELGKVKERHQKQANRKSRTKRRARQKSRKPAPVFTEHQPKPSESGEGESDCSETEERVNFYEALPQTEDHQTEAPRFVHDQEPDKEENDPCFSPVRVVEHEDRASPEQQGVNLHEAFPQTEDYPQAEAPRSVHDQEPERENVPSVFPAEVTSQEDTPHVHDMLDSIAKCARNTPSRVKSSRKTPRFNPTSGFYHTPLPPPLQDDDIMGEISKILEESCAPLPTASKIKPCYVPYVPKIREDVECIICMECDAAVTFLPCRHRQCCVKCAKMQQQAFDECPTCRCRIDNMLYI